jgi:hypothetical protein
VGSQFDDFAVIYYSDSVGFHCGCEAVRYQNCRATLKQGLQSTFYLCFGTEI